MLQPLLGEQFSVGSFSRCSARRVAEERLVDAEECRVPGGREFQSLVRLWVGLSDA